MNSNKKKNVIRKIVGMTATMAIASVFAPTVLLNTQGVLAQEEAAPPQVAPVKKYYVRYEFESDTPGKVLPGYVIDQGVVDITDYVEGQTVYPFGPLKNVVGEGELYRAVEGDGYWVFQGFDADSKTVQGGDVVFTGKWKWFDYVLVSYPIKVSDQTQNTYPGITFPKNLLDLEKESQKMRVSYVDYENSGGNEVTRKADDKLALWNFETGENGHHIDEENEGYWTYGEPPVDLTYGHRVEFYAYRNNNLPEIIKSSYEFDFTPTSRKVAYEFVSGTEGKDLPAAINGFMPEETEEYYYIMRNNSDYADKKVVAKQPTQTTYYDDTNKGTWTFVAYDFTEKQLSEWDHNGWNLKFKGTWTFVADEVPAPTPQPETTEETTQTPTTEAETSVEQPKTTEVPASEEKAPELPNTGTATALSTVVAGASVAFAGLGMIVLGRNRKED